MLNNRGNIMKICDDGSFGIILIDGFTIVIQFDIDVRVINNRVICRELDDMCICGPVIFDCLVSLGHNYNRFLGIDYIKWMTTKDWHAGLEVVTPPDVIVNELNGYFRANADMLSRSILSSAEVDRMVKGK